jgi:hypothetical protein
MEDDDDDDGDNFYPELISANILACPGSSYLISSPSST